MVSGIGIGTDGGHLICGAGGGTAFETATGYVKGGTAFDTALGVSSPATDGETAQFRYSDVQDYIERIVMLGSGRAS